jgi:uncharacterized repeat protein (TIGR01451 family)
MFPGLALKRSFFLSIPARLGIVLVLLVVALSMMPVLVAHADDFIIDDTGDEGDANLGDSSCDTGTGDCTLRAAIEQANALAGYDTISFSVGGTITLTDQLGINSSLLISGPGAGSLSISGDNSSRVITASSGITVTIIGVTIREGSATDGAGIYNNGILTLADSTVTRNDASLNGGGIFNADSGTLIVRGTAIITNTATRGGGIVSEGTLTITHSSVSTNTASLYAGGIRNRNGTAYIANSTVSGNTATALAGGGIENLASVGGATMTIESCTISGNRTLGTDPNAHGGGIRNIGYTSGITATLSITNSTISGNTTNRNGGGIANVFNDDSFAVINLVNSTVVTNTADSDSDETGQGGGIYIQGGGGGTVNVKNTIVADNGDNSTVSINPDCNGTLNSQDYNLIEAVGGGTGCTVGGTTTNNITGQDPNLGPLADNGGDTWTHALLVGSPAVNAGTCTGAPATDQRGVSRPQGTTCDIGAYEAQPELSVAKTVDDGIPNPGQLITFAIIIGNDGALTATNGLVSDTLDSSSFSFAGPVAIDPPGAGTPGTSTPTVASGVTIAPGQRVTVTFPVTVSASLLGGTTITNAAAVTSTIVVTPQLDQITMVVNSGPTANDMSISTNEDISVSDTMDASDPNVGDTLTYGILADPTSGTVTITDTAAGGFVYTPTDDLNGNDSFVYVVTDSGGLTDTATVSVTIRSVNDAPSFTKGADETVNEDTGAQSVSGWATGISAGAANESGQVLTFTLTNDNNPLFAVQPALDEGTGDLTYTPADEAFGSAIVTVVLEDSGGTVNGGVDTSPAQAFTITVNSVNDVPSFTKGADETANEDAGAQSVGGWATGISAGPANESGQVLTFTLTNDNNTLFAVQPAVDESTGDLTYTPADDAFGSAIVTVVLKDSGGTANGGVDTSPAQAFTITVDSVNDAPSFTMGANETVNEDAGAQSVSGWATGISAGAANESGQVLTFTLTNDNNTLFAVQPAVDESTGDLTYTPADDAFGSATVTVTLRDSGGTANGGVDTSTQTFAVTVNPVNDTPSFTKGADQEVDASAGPQTIFGWATDIVAGPANEADQILTFTLTNDNNALFAVQPAVDEASGDLTYTPAAGAFGTAVVTAILEDSGGTANGGDDTFVDVLLITVKASSLQVIKSVEGAGGSTTDLMLGDIITYTIVLTNNGTAAASGVVMTDPLPSGVSFGGWLDQGSAQLPPPTNDTIVWGPWDIPVGTDYTIRFTATITTDSSFAGATITNTAYFASANAAPGSDDAAFTITPPVINAIKDVVGEGGSTINLEPGSVVTYTIVLTNSGKSPATAVVMTDALPSGVSFGGWLDQGSAFLPSPADDIIKWGPHDVPAGTDYTIRFTATVTTDTAFAGAVIVNTAFFTSANAPPGSNDATFSLGGDYEIYLPMMMRNH